MFGAIHSPFIRNLLSVCLVVTWLAAAGWGIWQLGEYSAAPGAEGTAPTDWPAGSAMVRDGNRFTAVITLHPECPCSRASVEQIDAIVAQSADRLRVHALFVEMPGLPEPVEKSELWQKTSRIPGIALRKDRAGADARHFGARTSGETRLYNPAGRLVFRGGITLARGHPGDNPGHSAFMDLLTGKTTADAPITMPVFGCALWSEPSAPKL